MNIKEKKSIGKSGEANVRVLKNNISVAFADGDVYDLPTDALTLKIESGHYNVTLSQDGSKFVAIRPVGGTYIVKFRGFGNRNNEIPEPKILRGGPRQSKDGSKKWIQKDSLVFFADLEVLSEGKYQGLSINYMLPYSFVPASNPSLTDMVDSRRNVEKLETFLRISGFNAASEDIPFSPNVLPWLENYLLKQNFPFMCTITSEGWVDSLAQLPLELAGSFGKSKKSKK